MRPGRRTREAGFALIEAIAVMALSALVLMTLLIAADLVTRNSSAATRRAERVEALAAGLSALRRDIAGAVMVRAGESEAAGLVFSGRSGALALAVASDGSGGEPGTALVQVEARYGDAGGSLIRRSGRLLPGRSGIGDTSLGNPVVLLSGPWTYRFSYAAADATGLQWRDSWPAAQLLPAAVRLDIFDAAGRFVVPGLVVPIRVNAEIECGRPGQEPCGPAEALGTTEQEGEADAAAPIGQ